MTSFKMVFFMHFVELCIVCILVRHPDDGRRGDRNMLANSNV